MNCKMADLRAAFEAAGFTDVRTVLTSGNVVFDARSTSEGALEQKAEAAMHERMGKAFLTIVRPIEELRGLLATDPYRAFRVSPKAKTPKGPVFMSLLEKTLGKDQTTRTWDTIAKVAR